MHQSLRSDFASNPALQREIRTLLASFDEPSRSRMRAKMRHDRAAARDLRTEQADANALHTYHEFVLGRQLQRRGFHPEYNRRINGKTPDWFDERARLVLEVFTCEPGGTTPPPARVASRIAEKARKYAQTVRDQGFCFVIAVHGDPLGGLTAGDCEWAIGDGQLFATHLDLSGVIYFADEGPFVYFKNSLALRPVDLTL